MNCIKRNFFLISNLGNVSKIFFVTAENSLNENSRLFFFSKIQKRCRAEIFKKGQERRGVGGDEG